jgi:hypothetical protein
MPPASHSPPARKPRRWRKWLLLSLATATAAIVGVLFFAFRPERASEHFMEGKYCLVPNGRAVSFFASFHDDRFRFDGSYEMAVDGTYTLDGATLHCTSVWASLSPMLPEDKTIWHYRVLHGVPVLLTAKGLAIIKRDGGLQPAHSRDPILWDEMMVRADPTKYPSTWFRFRREHPRFAAALPVEFQVNVSRVSTRDYLFLRWQDFLIDHPGLRNRLPRQLWED